MFRKILVIAVVLLLLSPSAGLAQLLIEEGIVRLDVTPGETIVDTVTIHNTSRSNPAVLRVYWEDFEYVPPFSGKKKFLPPGTSKYSMNGWVNFSPYQITLAPLGKQKINYSIKVPPDAKGGYYGVLFFEAEGTEPQGNIAVNIVPRVGSLFIVESEDKRKEAHIEGLKVSGQSIDGVFVNDGNVFVFPKGIYYILDQEGLAVDRGDLRKMYITPGNSADFKINLPGELAPGQYTVVLTFDLGQGDAVVKEIDIEKDVGKTIRIIQLRD